MLNKLKELNKEINVYSVYDSEFSMYGRVIEDIDATEIISVAKTIEKPETGSKYVPTEPKFEDLAIAKEITDKLFGTLPTQIGYCWGRNTMMNATEWHTSSEINIAITPIVLIVALRQDIKDGKIDANQFKAFYVPEGTVLEAYATTLHYCPCQVADSGFGCVVGLPLDTNTPLETKSEDKLLFARNKWLLAHECNTTLVNDRGAVAGITGKNVEIKY